MRNRVPIVYLVDSAGVNLPYQDRVSSNRASDALHWWRGQYGRHDQAY